MGAIKLKEQHRARHIELHHALEELLEDWRFHLSKGDPDAEVGVYSRPVRDLYNWSHRQCIEPDARTWDELE